MPTPADVLAGLTTVANEWRTVAVAWHVLTAAGVLALATGSWRPRATLVARLLVTPLASVAALAAITGNPFNAGVFALLTVTLSVATTRIAPTPLGLASPAAVIVGAGLMVLGLTYPHFVAADSWTTYLYAAPFGLVPCPTLAMLLGATLVLRNLRAPLWSGVLAGAGLLYGVVGVFRLGVTLDVPLLAAPALLGMLLSADGFGWRSIRATRQERRLAMPGDDEIATPLATLTHGISIAAPANSVWPWLAQMGAGCRAGWYSYDVLDNGREPSAMRLRPELQDVTVGTVFPALPGVSEGFVVCAVEPERALVLRWPSPDGAPLVTWAFALEPRPDARTRLLVRVRGRRDYRFRGLPSWLSAPIVRLVHFVMERRQLLGIARRVESMAATARIAAAGRHPRRQTV